MTSLAMSPLEERAPGLETQAGTCRQWLHVVSHTDPRYGGLSSAVPALAASLGRPGELAMSLAAFCLPGEDTVPPELAREDISFWPTSRVSWLVDREVQSSFTAAVRQADGLHIHGLWEESTAVACKTARGLGKPYVLSAHGMLEPWALAAKQLKKRVYAALIERANVQGAACLHALTSAEAEQYRNFGARGPIAIVPNAVQLPQHAGAQLFLETFPALRGKRLLLFLSRLHPKKGLDLLVESWIQTAKQHPEAHLVIAGPDGEGMEAELRKTLEAHGIGDRVTFTGMLRGDLKWSALRAAEGYVLPSYSEGLSMALLEAMGMGLPVIATTACNMPEIATADAGWQIQPTSAALTNALHAFLGSTPQTNRQKGSNGAALIASRYTPQQVTRQMAEVYDFVLGGKRPAHVQLFTGGER